MKISGVYQIQSKIKPERIYIGSSVDIYNRWHKHLSILIINKHHSRKLQNHFNKYGESDLQFSILLSCDKSELLQTEQYFLDAYDPYFNVLKKAGSTLGFKFSLESLEKKRKSARKGSMHYLFGKKLPDQTKLKISIALTGRESPRKGCKVSKETRIKIGLSGKGRIASVESRKKMSDSKKKQISWNKGKKLTEEHKNNISKSNLNIPKPLGFGDKIKEVWRKRKLNNIELNENPKTDS